MSTNDPPPASPVDGKLRPQFATTRWSIVVAAGGTDDSAAARAALESLCQAYWYPLYAFARRQGRSADDAADTTQEFFSRLLDNKFLRSADPERGRFRSFLLTAFKRFIGQQQHRDQALKRGGGRKVLSLDFDDGERRYSLEPIDEWSAEKLFERRWALMMLEVVLQKLKTEYEGKGREELFNACCPWLTGQEMSTQYAMVAAKLGMNDGAIRVAVHRMRDRYRELLRLEVAGTVDDEQTVDDELRRLRLALRP